MEKNNKTLNVPNLRFPEFSGEWERCKIKQVCDITTGNKNTQDKSDDGIYPFYVRSQTVERINSWSFDGEAILTAGDGVGVGKVFHYSTGKIGVHQRVYILSNFTCDSKYLFHYFSSRFYGRVKRMSAKNSVDSVRMEMIADMPIYLASKDEQLKIGNLLSLLDERIETQKKIIEDLKKLKDAIRTKLFRHIESACTTYDEIRNMLDYEQPSEYLVSSTEYSDNYLTPVLTANKAFILGYTDDVHGTYDKGDCIILDDFTMDVKYVSFPFKVKSSAIKILTAKKDVDLYFMYEYLLHLDLVSEEHKRHYISEIEPMTLSCPTLQEQKRIAQTLKALDMQVQSANRLNDLLLKQKQYIVSQMFI